MWTVGSKGRGRVCSAGSSYVLAFEFRCICICKSIIGSLYTGGSRCYIVLGHKKKEDSRCYVGPIFEKKDFQVALIRRAQKLRLKLGNCGNVTFHDEKFKTGRST